MLKMIAPVVWAFDAEWVPDPATGRRVYSLDASASDEDVLRHMWAAGGATEEDPMPYLKTVLCRVVSVAAVIRKQESGGKVALRLHSVPADAREELSEKQLLSRFLGGVGDAQPQLVGYNSLSADVPILLQRALVNEVSAPKFCRRPNKPWEGVDYFARGSDYHIDLREEVGGWGKATPSLHEVASACGIPGKLDTTGQDVVTLWRAGNLDAILGYNECDALTTYLLWLRLVHLAGLVTKEGYEAEQMQLRAYLQSLATEKGKPHLAAYVAAWDRLRETPGTAAGSASV